MLGGSELNLKSTLPFEMLDDFGHVLLSANVSAKGRMKTKGERSPAALVKHKYSSQQREQQQQFGEAGKVDSREARFLFSNLELLATKTLENPQATQAALLPSAALRSSSSSSSLALHSSQENSAPSSIQPPGSPWCEHQPLLLLLLLVRGASAAPPLRSSSPARSTVCTPPAPPSSSIMCVEGDSSAC